MEVYHLIMVVYWWFNGIKKQQKSGDLMGFTRPGKLRVCELEAMAIDIVDLPITLWWTNIAIENGHRNSGFSHWKGWFSIAMLVHVDLPINSMVIFQFAM